MKESFDYKKDGIGESQQSTFEFDGRFDQDFSPKEHNSGCPDSTKSFGEIQLEIFKHRHGLLVLHLAATLMFVPSLAAWVQV